MTEVFLFSCCQFKDFQRVGQEQKELLIHWFGFGSFGAPTLNAVISESLCLHMQHYLKLPVVEIT